MKKYFLILTLLFTMSTTFAQNLIHEKLQRNALNSREDFKIQLEDQEMNHTFLPVTLIKGKQQGPVFTIIAGVHGYEYPPIVAIQELLKEIDPSKLTGSLVIIPIANIASFYTRTPFLNPLDKINLNNAFPGKQDGSITEQIAHFITSEIIPESDVLLDIHAGDANEDLLPFICYYDHTGRPQQTEQAAALSKASGFENIVSYPYTLKDDEPALYAFKQAVQDGKTALSIESGKLGNVQIEAVALIKSGVYNILASLEMYGTSEGDKDEVTHYNQQAYLKASEQGIFISDVKAGDTVIKNDVVGQITDEFGRLIKEVKAPESGTVLYIIGTPPVNPGETILCVGYKK